MDEVGLFWHTGAVDGSRACVISSHLLLFVSMVTMSVVYANSSAMVLIILCVICFHGGGSGSGGITYILLTLPNPHSDCEDESLCVSPS